MTITQPYQKRVGYTVRKQTTMLDAAKKKTKKVDHFNFQMRQMAADMRKQIPSRQQAHWSKLDAEKKIRDSLARSAIEGERRAILGYRTAGRFAPHLEARLREIESTL